MKRHSTRTIAHRVLLSVLLLLLPVALSSCSLGKQSGARGGETADADSRARKIYRQTARSEMLEQYSNSQPARNALVVSRRSGAQKMQVLRRRSRRVPSQLGNSIYSDSAELPLQGGYLNNKSDKAPTSEQLRQKKLSRLVADAKLTPSRSQHSSSSDTAAKNGEATESDSMRARLSNGLSRLGSTLWQDESKPKNENEDDVSENDSGLKKETEKESLIDSAQKKAEQLASYAKSSLSEAVTNLQKQDEEKWSGEQPMAEKREESPRSQSLKQESLAEKEAVADELSPKNIEKPEAVENEQASTAEQIDRPESLDQIEDKSLEVVNEQWEDDSKPTMGFLSQFGLGDYSLLQESIFIFAFMMFFFLVAWLRVEYESNFGSSSDK